MKVLFNLLLLGGLWGTFTVAAMAQEGEVNPLDTSPIAECLEPATITSGNQDNFCPHSRENAFGCWCQEVICNIATGHCRPGKFQRCPAVEWHEVFYNEPVALVETSCQAGKTVFADQQWRDQVVDHLSEVPAEALENYQACIDPRASNGVTYREARVWGLVEYEKRRAFFEHQQIPPEALDDTYICGYGGQFGVDIQNTLGIKGKPELSPKQDPGLPPEYIGVLLDTAHQDVYPYWREFSANNTLPAGAEQAIEQLEKTGYLSEAQTSLLRENKIATKPCDDEENEDCIGEWGHLAPTGWVVGDNAAHTNALVAYRAYQLAVGQERAIGHLREPAPTTNDELVEKVKENTLPNSAPLENPHTTLQAAGAAGYTIPKTLQQISPQVGGFEPNPDNPEEAFSRHHEWAPFSLGFPFIQQDQQASSTNQNASHNAGSRCYHIGASGEDPEWYNYRVEDEGDEAKGWAAATLQSVLGDEDPVAAQSHSSYVFTMWKETGCCLFKCQGDSRKLKGTDLHLNYVVYPMPRKLYNEDFPTRMSKDSWHIERYY